ncbi:hypothetical protein AS144_06860 [Francisella endosymbiont of Amblyomma maculatum]|nr:hypothetical protein AS144_06860 [Francisella endosymbiont of Amblyomma maculatum]
MFSAVKKLFWQLLFGIAIILIVLLSVLNTDTVSFDYIFGNTTLPLMLLLSISFVIGLVVGSPLMLLLSISFVIGLVVGSFITKFIQITKTNGGFGDC